MNECMSRKKYTNLIVMLVRNGVLQSNWVLKGRCGGCSTYMKCRSRSLIHRDLSNTISLIPGHSIKTWGIKSCKTTHNITIICLNCVFPECVQFRENNFTDRSTNSFCGPTPTIDTWPEEIESIEFGCLFLDLKCHVQLLVNLWTTFYKIIFLQ
jgi:hypothetical protein